MGSTSPARPSPPQVRDDKDKAGHVCKVVDIVFHTEARPAGRRGRLASPRAAPPLLSRCLHRPRPLQRTPVPAAPAARTLAAASAARLPGSQG